MTPVSDQPYDGPRCPSCQMPTKSHCFGAACPWVTCAGGHRVRVRDAHIEGDPGEYRPNTLGNLAHLDGHDDKRDAAHWDAVYGRKP